VICDVKARVWERRWGAARLPRRGLGLSLGLGVRGREREMEREGPRPRVCWMERQMGRGREG